MCHQAFRKSVLCSHCENHCMLDTKTRELSLGNCQGRLLMRSTGRSVPVSNLHICPQMRQIRSYHKLLPGRWKGLKLRPRYKMLARMPGESRENRVGTGHEDRRVMWLVNHVKTASPELWRTDWDRPIRKLMFWKKDSEMGVEFSRIQEVWQ